MSGSYWQLTERERAALTSEGVEEFLDYELMAAGVVRPRRPPAIEEPAVPSLGRVPVHAVVVPSRWYGGRPDVVIAFTDPAEAEAFLKLRPCTVAIDYETGDKFEFVSPLEAQGARVEQRHVVSFDSYSVNREALKKAKATTDAGDEARRAYDAAVQKADKVTGGVWEDWYRVGAKSLECQEVRDTLAEYQRLTGGNADMAWSFLRKAFDNERINDAVEWFAGEFAPPAGPAEGVEVA